MNGSRGIVTQQLVKVVLLLAASLMGGAELSAQEAGGEVLTNPALARVLNAELREYERSMAYTELMQLDAPQRRTALREIVARGDEGFAATAAAQLLRDQDHDVISAIKSRLVTWKPVNQSIVLQALPVGCDGPEPYREIARAKLNEIARTGKIVQTDTEVMHPVDLAAIYLAESNVAADIALLKRVVPLASQSRGVWMALASNEGVGAQERQIATRIGGDERVPKVTRVAAALAANGGNAPFVQEQIRAYLTKFGGKSVDAIAMAARQGDVGREEYGEFREGLRMLAILRYIDADTANPIVMELSKSNNELIRQIGDLLLAMRWPDVVVNRAGQSLGDAERHLLGLIVCVHPNLIPRVRELLDREYDVVVQHVSSGSLAEVFPISGSIVAGH